MKEIIKFSKESLSLMLQSFLNLYFVVLLACIRFYVEHFRTKVEIPYIMWHYQCYQIYVQETSR